MDDAAIAQVRALEDARCKATVERDVEALERLLHQELIYTHSSAYIDYKVSLIQGIRDGRYKYLRIDRQDIQMRAHGDTVFVTGLAKIQSERAGQPIESQIKYSDVWIRSTGGWQFALWHSCRAD